jgi:hypothetical protein
MRLLRHLLVVGLLAPSLGCTWAREQWGIGKPGGTGTIAKVTADDLVGYLNNQASRLQSITYGDATVSAREGLVRYPNLRGNLSAAQPRNFRMVAKGGLVDAKIDLGSNPEQFWAYVAAPTMQPMYVFASHTDFESGKARLPGNMPFEPDWVMQAMGMITFPPNLPYTVRIDEKERTYVLGWPATTPNGTQIRKEIVFLVDDADASRNQAQVRRHLIRDAKGKSICVAEVKAARTIPVGGTDPKSGRPFVVQYPTEVELRWEEQKFEMTLKLDSARVNQQLTPEDTRRLFALPNIGGATPVDLAYARFDSMGK